VIPVVSVEEKRDYIRAPFDSTYRLTVDGAPARFTDDFGELCLLLKLVTAQVFDVAEKRYQAGVDLKEALERLQ
jgi:hypothetical protein